MGTERCERGKPRYIKGKSGASGKCAVLYGFQRRGESEVFQRRTAVKGIGGYRLESVFYEADGFELGTAGKSAVFNGFYITGELYFGDRGIARESTGTDGDDGISAVYLIYGYRGLLAFIGGDGSPLVTVERELIEAVCAGLRIVCEKRNYTAEKQESDEYYC